MSREVLLTNLVAKSSAFTQRLSLSLCS